MCWSGIFASIDKVVNIFPKTRFNTQQYSTNMTTQHIISPNHKKFNQYFSKKFNQYFSLCLQHYILIIF